MAEPEHDTHDITARIWELLEPVIRSEGRELVEVEYRRESPGWVLRLFIDQPDGVTVEDCARISHVAGDLLDVADVLPNSYSLEVSSPGLNRPLRKPEHFLAQIGKIIEIKTAAPKGVRRNFKGVLLGADSKGVQMDIDGTVFEILYSEVERGRLRYFDADAM